MTILGLNHYNLRAPPQLLETLRAFYCDVVGLKVGFRPAFKSVGYWLYAGDHAVLHLSTALPEETPVTDAITTFDHVAFSCSDRAAVEQRLKKRGVEFRTAYVPQTSQVQLFFKDPASNGIELNFAGDEM